MRDEPFDKIDAALIACQKDAEQDNVGAGLLLRAFRFIRKRALVEKDPIAAKLWAAMLDIKEGSGNLIDRIKKVEAEK